MADNDAQLIQLITQAVLRAMEAGADTRLDRAASVQPPVGLCTGGDATGARDTGERDTGGAASARGAQDPVDAAPAVGTVQPPALSGIITAQQLREAIDAASDGVALLAHDARLTPLANDFVRENPDTLRRAQAASPNALAPGGVGLTRPWRWWAQSHCPAVVAATGQLGGRVAASAATRSPAGLVQAIHDIATGVHDGSLTGGLLFVSSAAQATVLANRCPSLRAVVGTCPQAVEQAIEQIGANVLIVEYPFVAPEHLTAMAARIVQTHPSVSPHTQRQLADLQRTG